MSLVGRKSAKWIGALFLLGVLFLASSFLTIDYLVDYWWYDSLGYAFYFIQRLLYRYLVFLGVTALLFLLFFCNFWIASRFLGTGSSTEPTPKGKPLETYRELLKLFRTGSMRVYTPLSLALAIVIALPLFDRWEAFLLFVFGPPSSTVDPAFGKDISYYLFALPIYTLLQRRIFICFAILLVGVLLLYWLEHRLLKTQDQGLAKGARIHLSLLIASVFGIEIWDFFLQQYNLLYSSAHEPLFSGPGYAEMLVVLPFIHACIGTLTLTAISTVYFVLTGKGFKIAASTAILFLLVLGARYSDMLPKLVNDYWVNPNAISRQSAYIRNNIEATLAAYNLTNVEIREVMPTLLPEGIEKEKVQGIFRNIPVWDGELLNTVYEQLQELRTYYDFAKVDVSHYNVRGNNQQVFLAAREMNTAELPKGARNWVNDHLVYTHGYGAVMTPAGQGGDEPMTWFLRGIPLESDYGFTVRQPAVYYGLLDNYPYVIAPNDAGEFGYPKGDSNVTVSYEGIGGVPINSAFRKLMFAYFMNDWDILFTTKTNNRSQILFRRNIRERIQRLTPYISLDQDPYVIVTSENLFWIQDAYTTSPYYPYSASYGAEGNKLNYIRNSIKIAVNAYTGSVDYYIFDSQDPIVTAYRRMYPGLFKDQSQMPPEIRSQVRYPQDLFDIQMHIYAKYHQKDPEVFYQQEDVWDVGIPEIVPEKQRPARSYYLTLDMIERNRFDFVLVSPVTPKGRANLRAMALAGSDRLSYGKLIVYSFPKGELVYGPAQIHSLINQDTMISQQFTLWDQVGSQVVRGKMIIFPIGRMLIYIQPVYLKSSTTLKIPELKRLIMTQGQVVVMEKSLEEAFVKLIERLRVETGRIDRRFAPLETPAPTTEPETSRTGPAITQPDVTAPAVPTPTLPPPEAPAKDASPAETVRPSAPES